jgi:TonB family protein
MRHLSARLTLAWILLSVFSACFAQQDQSNGARKVVSRSAPEYPQIARDMHLGGVVKVEATVLANGTVKTVQVRGGPPILTGAAADAVRRWKWMPATHETKEPVEVTFRYR